MIANTSERVEEKRETDIAAIGIICFILAFAGAVLNLPCFLHLSGEPIYLKIIWRYLILLIVLLPKFLIDLLSNIENIFNIFLANIFPILLLAILNTAQVYMIYYAVRHTYVAHTLLLCSIAPTFLATWKIAKNAPYTRLELLGIGFNVFGAYWCCCDGGLYEPESSNLSLTKTIESQLLMGDFVALFASAVNAAYILLSAPIVSEKVCPSSIYLTIMSFSIILFSMFMSSLHGENIQILSTDPVYGLFGFFGSQYASTIIY